jgi:hypothetical protein
MTLLAVVVAWLCYACVLYTEARHHRAERERDRRHIVLMPVRLDLIDPRIVVISAGRMTDASLHAEADEGAELLAREREKA